MADGASLKVRGRKWLGIYRAKLERDGRCRTSSGQRHFCTRCASALWMYAPEWPDLIHPFASAIDSALRSEEHTSELQSLMRISYAVFWLNTKNHTPQHSYFSVLQMTHQK